MPYIAEKVRQRLDHDLASAGNFTGLGESVATPGQLNYAITRLCLAYMPHGPTYASLNEIIGILECVKLEFYRRAVVPYEDDKIAENGDVYP